MTFPIQTAVRNSNTRCNANTAASSALQPQPGWSACSELIRGPTNEEASVNLIYKSSKVLLQEARMKVANEISSLQFKLVPSA